MVKIDNSITGNIEKLWNSLSKLYNVKHIYLYGSYAEDSYDEWSDIDLAVIVDEDSSHSREIFSMAKDYDIRFDAQGFKTSDFEKSSLPVIPEIKRKGIKIF